MLHSIHHILGDTIKATDGEIGSVFDCYFEDDTWHIRYLVVDTGHWLPGRRVLLAPVALGEPVWEDKELPVKLTRDKVRHSPDIETARPVSRQQEHLLHTYYMWPPYWGTGMGMSGMGAYPGPMVVPTLDEAEQSESRGEENAAEKLAEKQEDPHLRSAREVIGYDIEAQDGDMGDVEDFIVDDSSWTIRYLVVDTGRWLPGKRVLVATEWVRGIHWENETVHVELSKETIRNSPEYDHSAPISREYEQMLHDYYGRPGYWS